MGRKWKPRKIRGLGMHGGGGWSQSGRPRTPFAALSPEARSCNERPGAACLSCLCGIPQWMLCIGLQAAGALTKDV
jgi:hypothetical protein